ncbi:MAG: prolyl-tRNA synthetase associated domain-containing protein [Candidatus Micrarchaeota archaeon]|nr:prolyl-tRNA synthetase associated domain-containing protein [Candidatus Micrarchaeota archaeon]MDE1824207.1 prolyl-tRNA synthetase associated domain-containing protein [Candidatus Micrarchaeota archaeon]MDE1849666.1 prolyl-tRNA synthetase associated domain-containing protein [Candidatus Micrarchaeota archaeon]
MEQALESYLKKLGISYRMHTHKAVFTVEESTRLRGEIPGMHTKSLFLEDEKGNFYLVCMDAFKRLDIRALRKRLNAGKLQFASPDKLKSELNLTPGSVSIFGMINARNTKLIIDRDLWDAGMVAFHPNINTETLEITHDGLKSFCDSLGSSKEIIEL